MQIDGENRRAGRTGGHLTAGVGGQRLIRGRSARRSVWWMSSDSQSGRRTSCGYAGFAVKGDQTVQELLGLVNLISGTKMQRKQNCSRCRAIAPGSLWPKMAPTAKVQFGAAKKLVLEFDPSPAELTEFCLRTEPNARTIRDENRSNQQTKRWKAN